jgi:multiple antibiotic resistance protein
MTTTDLLVNVVIPAFATLFVVMDPVGVVPIFLALTNGADRTVRRSIAFRAVATAFGILLVFALFGKAALTALGIGLPAFRIAGGIMLFLIAVEMLFDKRGERRSKNAAEASAEFQESNYNDDDVAYFPLGMPLIAGPGAIAAMILLNEKYSSDLLAQGAVIGVMILVLAITFVLFIIGSRLEWLAGDTFTKIITRLLGLILGALAVQFVLSGLIAAGIVAH